MSLSSVLEKSKDFKAEKLIARNEQPARTWKPITIDTKQTESPPPSPPSKPPTDAHYSAKPAAQTDSTSPSTAQPGPVSPAAPPPQGPDTDSNQRKSPADRTISPEPVVDLETIRAEAYQAGVQDGIAQIESDYESALAALTQAGDQLNTIRETILRNSKAELIELVITLAEKIIRHSVTRSSDTIVSTIEQALLQAVKSSDFYIFVNPADLETVTRKSAAFIAGLNGLDNITIKSDPQVEQGGCKIESENCTVDATIVSQLEALREAIQKTID